MSKIISDADLFKSEKVFVDLCTVHWIDAPFLVVQSSTFLQSTVSHSTPLTTKRENRKMSLMSC